MAQNRYPSFTVPLNLGVGVGGVIVGVLMGLMSGSKPMLVILLLGALGLLTYFFTSFEQAVLAMLILRSALDIFSQQQIPAAFALGLDLLTLLYITLMLLSGYRVQTDKFWWIFASWVGFQSLWVILLPLGGLGLDSSHLAVSIREWVRLFSWLMVYLLVMQLKGIIHPEKIASALFLSLVAPLTAGMLQTFLPPSILPDLLVYRPGSIDPLGFDTGVRIMGTMGHPNGFAKFLLMFIALTWWKLDKSKQHWSWLLLLGVLVFFLMNTKALFSLGMFGVFVIVMMAQRANLTTSIGGIALLVLFLALFMSTDFGRERLGSIANTPLLNPHIDISRAILLSESDHNSFNWRISQWTYLLEAWKDYPLFGYGLNGTLAIPIHYLYAHNDYVRALVEGGIVGLMAFLAFLGAQMVRLVQLFKSASLGSSQRSLCSVLLALFIATLVGMCTDNVWSHTIFHFYWWTIFAISGWDWSDSSIKNTTKVNDSNAY